jgi:hypothetical protein
MSKLSGTENSFWLAPGVVETAWRAIFDLGNDTVNNERNRYNGRTTPNRHAGQPCEKRTACCAQSEPRNKQFEINVWQFHKNL